MNSLSEAAGNLSPIFNMMFSERLSECAAYGAVNKKGWSPFCQRTSLDVVEAFKGPAV